MKKFLALAGLAAALAVPSLAATSTWNLDPFHSNAQFTVRHLGISNVQGEFTKISGTVAIDDADITKSTVNVTIDATSVDTRVSRRDDDLKSPNFFDVAKFPTITFQVNEGHQGGRRQADGHRQPHDQGCHQGSHARRHRPDCTGHRHGGPASRFFGFAEDQSPGLPRQCRSWNGGR